MVEETILAFWKYKTSAAGCNDELVYQKACIEQAEVEGLEELPVAEIEAFSEVMFADWAVRRDGTGFEKRGFGEIRISMTKQALLFNCYEMDEDDLNALIDMAYEHGCVFYDPTLNKRFGPFPNYRADQMA